MSQASARCRPALTAAMLRDLEQARLLGLFNKDEATTNPFL